MNSSDQDKRGAQILSKLLPPHTLVVLTAMGTVESIIATRKKRMAKLITTMDDNPKKEQREAWHKELTDLMRDYAMLTAMIVDAYETVFSEESKFGVESEEDILRQLGIDISMLVPGPKEVQ